MSVFWKIFGFMRDRELAWQAKELRETGSYTGSGCVLSTPEEWAERTTLLEQMNEALRNEESGGASARM